ncbi:MAG: hypothetical protein AAF191_06340 [Verrucomicrobiota bacterium]
MCDYPTDEDRAPFFMSVAAALDQCQSLELALKQHIGASFEAARKYIGGRVTFELDERDFDKKSLGQLVDTYSKLTTDDTLVKELKDFSRDRNFLAHKAITESYLPDGTFSPSNSDGLLERVEKIQDVAKDLHQRVYDGAQRVLVHVWFDEISDEQTED